jgi:hypothetical protein
MEISKLNDSELDSELGVVSKLLTRKENELSIIRDRLRALKTETAIRKSGLKIGTEFTLNGKRGKIVAYAHNSCPIAAWLKKDGTIGERKSKLYSFEIHKLILI